MSVSIFPGTNANPATSHELARLMVDCDDVSTPCSSVTPGPTRRRVPTISTRSWYRAYDRYVAVNLARIPVSRTNSKEDGDMYALVKK